MNKKEIKLMVSALEKKFKWEAIEYSKIETAAHNGGCKFIAILEDYRSMMEAEAVDWSQAIQIAIVENNIESPLISFQLVLKKEWEVLKIMYTIEQQISDYYTSHDISLSYIIPNHSSSYDFRFPRLLIGLENTALHALCITDNHLDQLKNIVDASTLSDQQKETTTVAFVVDSDRLIPKNQNWDDLSEESPYVYVSYTLSELGPKLKKRKLSFLDVPVDKITFYFLSLSEAEKQEKWQELIDTLNKEEKAQPAAIDLIERISLTGHPLINEYINNLAEGSPLSEKLKGRISIPRASNSEGSKQCFQEYQTSIKYLNAHQLNHALLSHKIEEKDASQSFYATRITHNEGKYNTVEKKLKDGNWEEKKLSPNLSEVIPILYPVQKNYDLIMERGGLHTIGGNLPESSVSAKSENFQYLGTIQPDPSSLSWLDNPVILLVPGDLETDLFYIDHTDWQDPKPITLANPAALNKASGTPRSYPELRLSMKSSEPQSTPLGRAGIPVWLQQLESPRCPITDEPMRFLVQLHSNKSIKSTEGHPLTFNGDGYLYVFYAPISHTACYLMQNS